VVAVGVFVDAPVDEIEETVEAAGLDLVQLHGGEPPALVQGLRAPAIKALRSEPSATAGTLVAMIDVYRGAARPPIAYLVDGFAAGTLRQWSIGSDGSINASYDNGRNAVIDTIQLATFDNPGGLLHVGQNMFTVSSNSGIAHIGNPGTGGAGTLLPGALEGSNVDLAKQFTDLITAQRGFEASARVIRVGDEVLQTVVNIKQ